MYDNQEHQNNWVSNSHFNKVIDHRNESKILSNHKLYSRINTS